MTHGHRSIESQVRKREKRSVTAYAVQVDGASQTVASGTRTLSLLRNDPDPNTDFIVQEVVDAIGRPLSPLEEDWLDLLHCLHISDLVCHRGKNENWHRDITLALPLRDPVPFKRVCPFCRKSSE